ncbi:MAG: single-stranded-DNA-specific exonuclease RecJ [Clostridiales bacterium]|nr:single-stranded-DNA-specific exonuclease RecJ [Clostridiales bacterium]
MFDSSKWNVLDQDAELVSALSSVLGVDEICAKLLINRGYTDAQSAKDCIEKSDVFFHNPFLMKDMEKAVEIISDALKNEEKITIYGDYDVDGVTSVSILYMYLREHGGIVDYYIPTRESEGYGLNTSAFDTIKRRGTSLIITVDTGITAIEEVEYAKSIGMKVIVTDHHQCRAELPEAEAVVNPKRPDCEYPFKELSGVGVVFKIICALELSYVNGGEYNLYTIKDMCRRYIDIVTIGTVADVMPLVGENRIIVHLGLGMLKNVHHVGIRALFRAAGIIGGTSPKKITATTIGFSVAPKINAVGRISSAERAVKLFLTDSPANADVIAEELCAINRERQETENVIYKEAFDQLQNEPEIEKASAIVLESETWHHGVIGIVASRITEKFGVPSVLISFDGAEPDEEGRIIGKGSVRSIKGINIVEALSACSDLLYKFGGHALAAGLSIEKKNVAEFRRRLNEYVGNALKGLDFVQKLDIDMELDPEDVTESEAEAITILEPYGAGNPVPLFLIRNAKIREIVALSGGKHTKMMIEKSEKLMYSVIFGTNLVDEGYMCGDEIDVVCSMDINEFRGTRSVQLVIKDIDRSDFDKSRFDSLETEITAALNTPETILKSDVPTRDDFALVYRSLGGFDGGLVNFRALANTLPDFSYNKLAIVIKTFSEAGLINVLPEKGRRFMLKITFNQTTEKADLFATPIMQSISK